MEEIHIIEIVNDGALSYMRCDSLKHTIKGIYNTENPAYEDEMFAKELVRRLELACSNEDYIDILDYANSYNQQWIYTDLYVVVDITGELALTKLIKKQKPVRFIAKNNDDNDISWCDIKLYDYNWYVQTNDYNDSNTAIKANRCYYIHNCYDRDIATNIVKLLVNEC